MSKITDEILDDLMLCVIDKLKTFKLPGNLSVLVERDSQSPNVVVTIYDGINQYYTMIDEILFYKDINLNDIAIYAIGSINTLIELGRKR